MRNRTEKQTAAAAAAAGTTSHHQVSWPAPTPRAAPQSSAASTAAPPRILRFGSNVGIICVESTRRMSDVTRHTSHVKRHTSHVTRHLHNILAAARTRRSPLSTPYRTCNDGSRCCKFPNNKTENGFAKIAGTSLQLQRTLLCRRRKAFRPQLAPDTCYTIGAAFEQIFMRAVSCLQEILVILLD